MSRFDAPGPTRRSFLAGLGLAGVGAVAGCTGAPANRTVGGTYRVGVGSDATTLNFLSVSNDPAWERVHRVLDGPYAVTPDLEVFPLWCDIDTDDNRVYEVTLRENLEWSDPYGSMTAEDWVYMIRNVFQAPDNWAGYPSQGDWKMGGEFVPVEKTGKYTFEIRLPQVDPAFPLRPALWGEFCMPKGLLERYVPGKDAKGLERDEEVQTLAYAGNLGPYEFDSWRRDSSFVATRNPDYYMHDATDVPGEWGNAPYFDRFVYRVVPDVSTRLLALKRGELTQTELPESKAASFEANDSVRVVSAPQPYLTVLNYNMRANGWRPFRRVAVRRALAWAVNKRAIVDDIMRGYADVAYTFQPEWSKWFDDSEVLKLGADATYDPQTAREKLGAALGPTDYGYEGDRVVGPEGPVTLTLVYASTDPVATTRAEFVKQSYADVGLDVALEGAPLDTIFSQYAANAMPGGDPSYNAGPRDEATSQKPWDLLHAMTFNTYPRTPTAARSYFVADGPVNFYGYVPEADVGSLFDRAEGATDDGERLDALAEIFGVLSREQPFNFLAMGAEVTGYQSDVVGPEAVFGNGWNYQTWSFE